MCLDSRVFHVRFRSPVNVSMTPAPLVATALYTGSCPAVASLSIAVSGGRLMALRAAAACLVFALAIAAATEVVGIASTALKKHGKLLAVVLMIFASVVPPIGAAAAGNEQVAAMVSPFFLSVWMLEGSMGWEVGFAGALAIWGLAAGGAFALHRAQRRALAGLMRKRAEA